METTMLVIVIIFLCIAICALIILHAAQREKTNNIAKALHYERNANKDQVPEIVFSAENCGCFVIGDKKYTVSKIECNNCKSFLNGKDKGVS